MKVIMVMFDSLNRHMLPPYGCDWTHAPNFTRLAQRALTFDRSYVCSMPCMPARRDLHTGRPNFLHRAWGPLEPFDDSVPQMLREAGIYTHMATDHYHYFEDGGATYHTRYNSWQFFRGQEGDPWRGQVSDPQWPDGLARNGQRDRMTRQDVINRSFMQAECAQPQPLTFGAGLDFIRGNYAEDNWFLQIETFDPHEPFFSHRKYKDLYPHEYSGPRFDWPPYRAVQETPEEVQHCRYEYAALLSMCDAYLGDVLDLMDEKDLWHDTMLIVWTDHGFLLGEHDFWAKLRTPFYEEIAHTPFFIYDPRNPLQGERRSALVQPSIDLGPTLLEFFGLQSTDQMLGQSLRPVIENDTPVREAGIFGVFGGQVNVTDGRYVYMRATENDVPLFEYTQMPTRMNQPFTREELQHIEIAGPFGWTHGCRVMQIGNATPSVEGRKEKGKTPWLRPDTRKTLLYDVQADPQQQNPLQDPEVEARMITHLQRLLHENEAPAQHWQRLGLDDRQSGNKVL